MENAETNAENAGDDKDHAGGQTSAQRQSENGTEQNDTGGGASEEAAEIESEMDGRQAVGQLRKLARQRPGTIATYLRKLIGGED